jgi:hypothetical protein
MSQTIKFIFCLYLVYRKARPLFYTVSIEGLTIKNKRGCYKLKIKKKQVMVLSFVIGSILFASTAFAEISSKSGYDQLKDALKYTAESCTSKLLNYTLDLSMVIKDNGNIISQQDELMKYDVTKGAKEDKSTSINGKQTSEEYNYSDKNENINFSKDQNIYFVNTFDNQREPGNITNPFKEKQAADIEKIADAVVGNLKDSIMVTENADGTKQLSGNLSEVQIPAIVNAVVSYGFKSRLGNSGMGNRVVSRAVKVKALGGSAVVKEVKGDAILQKDMAREEASDSTIPNIVDDIYVKEVKGNMTLNKEGLIESAMGSGTLSGKDEKGIEHKITFEVLAKMSDVNKTVVSKPDLTGKNVQTNVMKDYRKVSKPEMYIGTYKNDIVIEKNSKFEKIGERIIDITSLDDKNVTGKYYEKYTAGNEEYSSKAREFNFSGNLQDGLIANFTSTDTKGQKVNGNLFINVNTASIILNIDEAQNKDIFNSGEYNRVFN